MTGSPRTVFAPARRSALQLLSLRPAILVALALAGILVIGAPGPWPFGHGAGQADVNLGPGDQFSPATITVHEGDTVVWHFDGNSHTVTSVGGPGQAWDSGKLSTGTYSHSFSRAGTYPYVCALHSKMSGTIVVLPPDTTQTTPPAGSAPSSSAPTSTATPTAASATPANAAATPAAAPTAGAAKPADAAPPRIAGLHVALSRSCRSGHCSALATLTASEAGTVTVHAGARHLLAAHVKAGRQRLRVPLDRVRRGRTRLTFALADAAGNHSKTLVRSVSVR